MAFTVERLFSVMQITAQFMYIHFCHPHLALIVCMFNNFYAGMACRSSMRQFLKEKFATVAAAEALMGFATLVKRSQRSLGKFFHQVLLCLVLLLACSSTISTYCILFLVSYRCYQSSWLYSWCHFMWYYCVIQRIVTNVGFNSFRTQSSKRPVSLIQLIMDAKNEARAMPSKDIEKIL